MKKSELIWCLIILILFAQYSCATDDEDDTEEGTAKPTDMICPDDMYKINLYSCGIDQDLAVPSKCQLNQECWDGTCMAKDLKEKYCPTQMTCPDEKYRYRCPDNTCVDNPSKCPKYMDCPQFSPIRCASGDCRKTLEDCPSLLTCPSKLPIQCNDGSCHLTPNSCTLSTEQSMCSDGLTRCPDGTCASSKFLCPTLVTCPKGYVKCWDGNCAVLGECPESEASLSSTCGADDLLICQFDYSCAGAMKNCPTGIICPVDKPVKCWDNSCRDSINNCPAYQHCPSGLKSCPDGSCGIGSCGTHITCSDEAPFRCFDNTCRQNPEDCPTQPSCPAETPILCWDGRCLAERGECLAPSKCDSIYPVKCPNGLCAKKSDSCKKIDECPSEFVKCSDGTCRKKLAYCPAEDCPVNLPHKCSNGLCVTRKKYCDQDNGCPFNLPVRCSNGDCVVDKGLCKDFTCPEGKKLCADGSCLSKKVVCPYINGCPSDTPLRCADGSCINPKKGTCSIPICHETIPIKCFDGTCVDTVSFCPTERKIAESGNVLCANGQEANSYEECKPLTKCLEDEVRCGDGTCRYSEDECPNANTCPNQQVRCPNGSCAKDKDSCPDENGCPLYSPFKCPNTGYCVKAQSECATLEGVFDEPNGCSSDKSLKCSFTGKCVSNLEDCVVDAGCPTGWIMCDDGYCTDQISECKEHMSDLCAGATCPALSAAFCADTLGGCFNQQNCHLDTPFRCLNGDCKRYPSTLSSNEGCEIGISCPSYKPYLCADGSCVEKPSFCKSFTECPTETPYLCFDRTCAESKDACISTGHNKCPAKNPMQCPNNNCVSSIFDCSDTTCPYWVPYKCLNGKCTTKPRFCNQIIFNAVTFEYDFGSVCKGSEFQCFDGTCRATSGECPIYPGCGGTDKPYKCLDGSCALNKESCDYGNNPEYYTCAQGTELCQDGLCRADCSLIEYNGCPNETPLLCPNGRCATLLQECVGESACDSTEKPFRCLDGSCGATISECKSPFREFGTTNVTIAVFPQMEVEADLIIGKDNARIGRIEIPAEAITIASTSENKQSVETQVYLRSIPRNHIDDTWTTYDETRVDDLKAVYPYADPGENYTLTYHYCVLSSAIEISIKGSPKNVISGKVLFTLAFDFPFKHTSLQRNKNIYAEEEEEDQEKATRYTTKPLDFTRDACLARLNVTTRKWECTGYQFNVEALSDLQLTGELDQEGIYAVILNLVMNDNPLYITPNWFLAHLKELSIAFLILMFIIGIGFYIFIRIYRYRVKYKDTKEIYKGFELELSDLQDKSVTGRQGQTYGDVKEGIIYTDNIAFKSQIDADARRKNTQLEKLFDSFTKRLRLLERNNALLKGQYESIKNEYNRLNDYKASLNANLNAEVNVNISDANEMKPINDDDED